MKSCSKLHATLLQNLCLSSSNALHLTTYCQAFLPHLQSWLLLPLSTLHSCCIKHLAITLTEPCCFTPPCFCWVQPDNHTACILMPTPTITLKLTTLMTLTYVCILHSPITNSQLGTKFQYETFHISLSRPSLPINDFQG